MYVLFVDAVVSATGSNRGIFSDILSQLVDNFKLTTVTTRHASLVDVVL